MSIRYVAVCMRSNENHAGRKLKFKRSEIPFVELKPAAHVEKLSFLQPMI